MALDYAMETFRRLWREVLGLEQVDDSQNFFEVGGDSLLAVRLLSRCRENGLTLSPKDIFTLQTLGALTQRVSRAVVSDKAASNVKAETNLLLPAQNRWLDGRIIDINHFNLGWLFYAPKDLTHDVLRQVVETVLWRQEALRTAYRETDKGWTAQVMPVNPDASLLKAELDDYRTNEEAMSTEIARAHQSMNIYDGIVFRVLHFPFGEEPGRLLVLAHHLTLDGFSVSLLADEMEQALQSALGGTTQASPVTTSPCRYAEVAKKWTSTKEAAEDLKKWLGMPWHALAKVPTEKDGEGLLTSLRTVTGEVAPKQTKQLNAIARKHGLGLSEILLAAAIGAVAEWSGRNVHGVDVYHHGRDITPLGIDVTQTIAYIQNTFPVLLNWDSVGYETGWFEKVAAQFKVLPDRRFGFDALRYYDNPGRSQLQALPRLQLRYNFRGHMNRINERKELLLQPAPESFGRHRSPRQNEKYLLMLEGDVIDGKLVFGIKFSEDFYSIDTIQLLVDRIVALLNLEANQLGG
ncbi:MAG: hypothetical protein K6T83_06180 [Alicyclobacillus sp.]|nr:hypothetical protein [Alicyclobacillus sp.]